MAELYKPEELVYIVYGEDGQEAGRGYPATEEDCDDLMDWASNYDKWECITREMAAARDLPVKKYVIRKKLSDGQTTYMSPGGWYWTTPEKVNQWGIEKIGSFDLKEAVFTVSNLVLDDRTPGVHYLAILETEMP